MLVSVITPSLNQGKYLEENLRSVAAQEGAEIEHIVIDGASTDNTLQILERWGSSIKWISEPDEGQSHAFNKGLQRARGEIIGWLNADDAYLPGVVAKVVDYFHRHPGISVVYGDVAFIDQDGREILRRKEVPFDRRILIYGHNLFAQPASFMKKGMLDRIGGLDTGLRFSMDYELFLRALNCGYRFGYLREYMAAFRFHRDSKSSAEHTRMMEEHRRVLDRWRAWRVGADWVDAWTIRCLRTLYRLKKTIVQYGVHGEFRPYAIRRAWYGWSGKRMT